MDEDGCAWIIICGLALFVFGVEVGFQLEAVSWRKQAVSHGAARYNAETAKFEWIQAEKAE